MIWLLHNIESFLEIFKENSLSGNVDTVKPKLPTETEIS